MANEVQSIVFSPAPTSGTFTLTYASDSPVTLNWNDPAATIQAALEGSPSIGSGNISVSGEADTGTITLTYQGALANTDVPQVTCDASGLTGQGTIGVVVETVAGTNPSGGTKAVATWTFDSSSEPNGSPNDGTYTVDGQTAGPAGGLSDSATWTFTGNPFSGTLTATALANGVTGSPPTSDFSAMLDVSDSNWLANGGVVTPSFTDGTNNTDPGTAEVQSLPYPVAVSGSFLLQGQTIIISPATFDPSAADIQTALDTAFGAGATVVTQPGGAGTAFTITWQTNGPQSLLTVDGSDLTGGVAATVTTTTPGGGGTADDAFNRLLLLIG